MASATSPEPTEASSENPYILSLQKNIRAINKKLSGMAKTDAVINPFAIQTPADGATVVAADHMVTFTGTGAAGATVELINDLGGPWERVVARATVGHDGTWTATGGLGFQTYPLAYVHTPGELGGTPATGTTTVTVVAE